jgi:hypothetical protein
VLSRLAEEREHPRPAGAGHDRTPAVPVDGSGPNHPVRLRLDGDTQGRLQAASAFRLVNPTDRPVGPVGLHVDDLHTPHGDELTGSCVRFDPPVVDGLAPGSSRTVRVTASTDGRLAPGTYRGIIQSAGAPALGLPLEVDVLASGP